MDIDQCLSLGEYGKVHLANVIISLRTPYICLCVRAIYDANSFSLVKRQPSSHNLRLKLIRRHSSLVFNDYGKSDLQRMVIFLNFS